MCIHGTANEIIRPQIEPYVPQLKQSLDDVFRKWEGVTNLSDYLISLQDPASDKFYEISVLDEKSFKSPRGEPIQDYFQMYVLNCHTYLRGGLSQDRIDVMTYLLDQLPVDRQRSMSLASFIPCKQLDLLLWYTKRYDINLSNSIKSYGGGGSQID
eukprot:gene42031-52102_t